MSPTRATSRPPPAPGPMPLPVGTQGRCSVGLSLLPQPRQQRDSINKVAPSISINVILILSASRAVHPAGSLYFGGGPLCLGASTQLHAHPWATIVTSWGMAMPQVQQVKNTSPQEAVLFFRCLGTKGCQIYLAEHDYSQDPEEASLMWSRDAPNTGVQVRGLVHQAQDSGRDRAGATCTVEPHALQATAGGPERPDGRSAQAGSWGSVGANAGRCGLSRLEAGRRSECTPAAPGADSSLPPSTAPQLAPSSRELPSQPSWESEGRPGRRAGAPTHHVFEALVLLIFRCGEAIGSGDSCH